MAYLTCEEQDESEASVETYHMTWNQEGIPETLHVEDVPPEDSRFVDLSGKGPVGRAIASIKFFNNTLRPGERRRILQCVVRVEERRTVVYKAD